jgi:hypothetical protein
MTKSMLVLPILFAAACVDSTYPELQEAPTTPVETTQVATAGNAPVVIATGGTQGFAIDDAASIGLEGNASDGYQVEPAGNAWPNMTKPLYWVRALRAGLGSFEIITNKGIASGLVESSDVASVALVPADYQLDGSSPFAIDTNRLGVQVVLADRDGRRLVDATLGISGDQTAWDHATRPAIVGRHLVRAYADSFGERELAIEVVAGIDRVESAVTGNVTCFHAYAGATEIATTLAISGGTPVDGASNCVVNAPTDVIAVRR